MTQTDRIRNYIRDVYVGAARKRGESTVRVVAGEVHRALGLHSRVPMVCNALRSRSLLEECGMEIVAVEGPPSGQSTTVTVVYALEGKTQKSLGTPQGHNPFRTLRGAGRKTFEELGGGEAFLRSEREAFYK